MFKRVYVTLGIVFALILLGTLIIASGGPHWPDFLPRLISAEEAKDLPKRQVQKVVDTLIPGITYMKDPRTGICFAYTSWYSELMFATVDCGKIPADLLFTATLK